MNIIFLGAPGSGKGTQAEILESKFGLKKLSTGDILREEVRNKSELGIQVQKVIEAGQLISDHIMISMISKYIENLNFKNGFILDGFPRTLTQAQALNDMFIKNDIELNAVIVLNVDRQALIDRITARFNCADCNASYNKITNNTKVENVCDKCRSVNFLHRNDDDIKTLMHRLEIFDQQMSELVPYYKERNILFTVNGMNDISKVTEDINLILKQ